MCTYALNQTTATTSIHARFDLLANLYGIYSSYSLPLPPPLPSPSLQQRLRRRQPVKCQISQAWLVHMHIFFESASVCCPRRCVDPFVVRDPHPMYACHSAVKQPEYGEPFTISHAGSFPALSFASIEADVLASFRSSHRAYFWSHKPTLDAQLRGPPAPNRFVAQNPQLMSMAQQMMQNPQVNSSLV